MRKGIGQWAMGTGTRDLRTGKWRLLPVPQAAGGNAQNMVQNISIRKQRARKKNFETMTGCRRPHQTHTQTQTKSYPYPYPFTPSQTNVPPLMCSDELCLILSSSLAPSGCLRLCLCLRLSICPSVCLFRVYSRLSSLPASLLLFQ